MDIDDWFRRLNAAYQRLFSDHRQHQRRCRFLLRSFFLVAVAGEVFGGCSPSDDKLRISRTNANQRTTALLSKERCPPLSSTNPIHKRLLTKPSSSSYYNRISWKTRLLAFSEYGRGEVDIYLQGRPHQQIARLTGLPNPQGIAFDIHYNLYVTTGHKIEVYAPSTIKPQRMLADDDNFPNDVAIGNAGTVYVSNQFDNTDLGSRAGIIVYKPNEGTASKVLTDGDIRQNFHVAIAPNRDVYTSYYAQYGQYRIGVFRHGSMPMQRVNIDRLQSVAPIRFYSGRLYVADQDAATLTVYRADGHRKESTVSLAAAHPQAFDLGTNTRSIWLVDVKRTVKQVDAHSGKLLDYICAMQPSVAAVPEPNT